MTKNRFVSKIPYGTRDFLFGDAYTKRYLEADLARLFFSWGYNEVVTPTFEYAQIFDGNVLDKQAFKFFDREGEALALRADMTCPIARMASVRLNDWQKPKRLSYISNVFRYEKAQTGRQCEFYQAGVEMLGATAASSDAEVIALAAEALRGCSLDNFKISLGHVDFLNGIVESAKMDEDTAFAIRELLSNRDLSGLERYANSLDLEDNVRECLQKVLFLQGDKSVLDKARSFCDNAKSLAALDNLQEIYDNLAGYGVCDKISFDLGLIRDFGYYTGMVFEGYSAKLGFPICGGGRYDNLMAGFGQDCPAIGFALGVDRLLLALERENKKSKVPKQVVVAFSAGRYFKALRLAQKMRADNISVELCPEAVSKDEAKNLSEGRELFYISD